MLGGFCLQFSGSLQVWHISQVHADGVAAKLPAHLTDSFHKRSAFDITYGTTHFGDHEVQFLPFHIRAQHPPLDLVGDVRHNLDGLSEIIASTLPVNDGLVDTPRGYGIVFRGMDARETFIVPEVQVRLHPVGSDIAFAVLVWIERSGVDIDVRVEFLYGDLEAAGLQQLPDTCGNDTLAQG